MNWASGPRRIWMYARVTAIADQNGYSFLCLFRIFSKIEEFVQDCDSGSTVGAGSAADPLPSPDL
jgi:hypothetical protein